MPRYEKGNSYQDMLEKVEDAISGTNDVLISLGGYGGYVTFGFDHTVMNRPGKRTSGCGATVSMNCFSPIKRVAAASREL